MINDIVFLSGVRTPFGEFNGSFKNLTATELGVMVSKEAILRSGVDKKEIDCVVFGNVIQTSKDAIYLARHIGLLSGLKVETPALTINRLCGSGFQAIVTGSEQLLLGEANFALVGGTENMSQTPHVIRGARSGLPLGKCKLEDTLWEGLTDTFTNLSMAASSENLGDKYSISRREVDEFAFLSQKRYSEANNLGYFKKEIIPVKTIVRGKEITIDKDEHPRETTIETLSKLKPVFKENGLITAGNASGINDGAASLIITTVKNAQRYNLKPIGRLISYGISGCDPYYMGIGPVSASKIALTKASFKLADIDLIEINEAFSPQYLACEKELELDREKTNVNGGAIAIGHPLAASGARITIHLLNELARRKKKYGLGSACIGGGQGIALIVEAFI
jgi:acetyl-CoA C-acetyltransferase